MIPGICYTVGNVITLSKSTMQNTAAETVILS